MLALKFWFNFPLVEKLARTFPTTHRAFKQIQSRREIIFNNQLKTVLKYARKHCKSISRRKSMPLFFSFCSWWSSFKCFFGGAGCSAVTGVRGTVHILSHLAAHLASANLLRYSEGATWLAIVIVSRFTPAP